MKYTADMSTSAGKRSCHAPYCLQYACRPLLLGMKGSATTVDMSYLDSSLDNADADLESCMHAASWAICDPHSSLVSCLQASLRGQDPPMSADDLADAVNEASENSRQWAGLEKKSREYWTALYFAGQQGFRYPALMLSWYHQVRPCLCLPYSTPRH